VLRPPQVHRREQHAEAQRHKPHLQQRQPRPQQLRKRTQPDQRKRRLERQRRPRRHTPQHPERRADAPVDVEVVPPRLRQRRRQLRLAQQRRQQQHRRQQVAEKDPRPHQREQDPGEHEQTRADHRPAGDAEHPPEAQILLQRHSTLLPRPGHPNCPQPPPPVNTFPRLAPDLGACRSPSLNRPRRRPRPRARFGSRRAAA